jgi:hypothetical protein
MGMQLARQETAVKRFYQKKAKQIGQAKAQVAAARKLSAVVWWILTNRSPYPEQDEGLSARKADNLDPSGDRTASGRERGRTERARGRTPHAGRYVGTTRTGGGLPSLRGESGRKWLGATLPAFTGGADVSAVPIR